MPLEPLDVVFVCSLLSGSMSHFSQLVRSGEVFLMCRSALEKHQSSHFDSPVSIGGKK